MQKHQVRRRPEGRKGSWGSSPWPARPTGRSLQEGCRWNVAKKLRLPKLRPFQVQVSGHSRYSAVPRARKWWPWPGPRSDAAASGQYGPWTGPIQTRLCLSSLNYNWPWQLCLRVLPLLCWALQRALEWEAMCGGSGPSWA